MNFNDTLIIAVDFDGTIAEDAYPKIGKPMLFAFETLKNFKLKGIDLFYGHTDAGDRLDEAVKFCEENGIHFYAVNKSFPEEEYTNEVSRKINADFFIDDRNIGGFYGWGEIYQLLTNSTPPIPEKKKGFFDFFK